MRDYRDAKAMARTLRSALAAKGAKISIAESLELIAKAFGSADWNTLSASIRDNLPMPAEPHATRPAQGSAPVPRSPELEATFSRATESAKTRHHRLTTLEHLLLALIDDPEGRAAMETSGVDLVRLGRALRRYVDEDLQVLSDLTALRAQMPEHRKADVDRLEGSSEPGPTAGLHRAAVRATDYARLWGIPAVTGSQMLATIVLNAGDCQAAGFLATSGMTRHAALGLVGGAR